MKSKLLKISVLLITLVAMLATVVFAEGLKIPEPNYGARGVDGINNGASNIAGIIAAIGAGVAIAVLIWLAIKYITAAPSDKADIKKSAVAYVIGAVLLFAASGVLALIQGFATDFGKSLESSSTSAVQVAKM